MMITTTTIESSRFLMLRELAEEMNELKTTIERERQRLSAAEREALKISNETANSSDVAYNTSLNMQRARLKAPAEESLHRVAAGGSSSR
jgi:hypothetical protein